MGDRGIRMLKVREDDHPDIGMKTLCTLCNKNLPMISELKESEGRSCESLILEDTGELTM